MTRWTSYRYVQNINEHMKLDQSFQLYITSASLQLCVSCIIVHCKIKEAAMGYNAHVHHGSFFDLSIYN